jgi:hypothetical protein
MKIEKPNNAFVLLMLIIFCATSAWAQGVVGEAQRTGGTNAIRLIRDPHTALHWLLERDPARPGGPGRMILLGEKDSSQMESHGTARQISEINLSTPRQVIRSGDRLVIEEHSAVVEARFECVALGPAIEGQEFRARLAIGGKMVRAVAIAPGLAVFAPDAGRRQ